MALELHGHGEVHNVLGDVLGELLTMGWELLSVKVAQGRLSMILDIVHTVIELLVFSVGLPCYFALWM
jgi:hypothetical protein